MIDYSRVVENQFPELDDNIRQLRYSVSSLIVWVDVTSEDPDDLFSFREVIATLFDSIGSAREVIGIFRDAVQSLLNQGISRSINRASSRLVRVTNSLLDMFHDHEEFCLDTIDLIDDKLS